MPKTIKDGEKKEEDTRRSKRNCSSIYSSELFSSPKIKGLKHKRMKSKGDIRPETLVAAYSLFSDIKKDSTLTPGEIRVKHRRIEKVIKSLRATSMNRSSYIESSLDEPHLVEVHPVNLLQSVGGGDGLFAKQATAKGRFAIAKGTCIGVYTGEVYATKGQYQRYLKENPTANNHYAMEVAGRIIDAKEKGNFTRFINFSDAQDNVAFEERILNRKKVTVIVAMRDIAAGEQLLINYNTYDENDSKLYFFLNPGDNWRSAEQVHQENHESYECVSLLQNFPLFKVQINDSYYMTTTAFAVFNGEPLDQLTPIPLDEFDLPVLKLDSEGRVLGFEEADAFTPLQLACYLGQVNNVNYLLNQSANVNQQQNHSGYNPLSIALDGYATRANSQKERKDYLTIMRALIANNANLFMHDRKDQTFIHLAIATLSASDFKSIMTFIANQKNSELGQLLTYIDENDFDIVTLCLKNKDLGKFGCLLALFPEYFIDHYEGTNAAGNRLNKDAFMKAVSEYSEVEIQELSNFCEKHDIAMSDDLKEELGLSAYSFNEMSY